MYKHRLIKLINGSEIIGGFVKEDDKSLTFKNPLLITTVFDEEEKVHNYIVTPYTLYSNIVSFEKKCILFQSNNIFEGLIEFYNNFVYRMYNKIEHSDDSTDDSIKEETKPLSYQDKIFNDFLKINHSKEQAH